MAQPLCPHDPHSTEPGAPGLLPLQHFHNPTECSASAWHSWVRRFIHPSWQQPTGCLCDAWVIVRSRSMASNTSGGTLELTTTSLGSASDSVSLQNHGKTLNRRRRRLVTFVNVETLSCTALNVRMNQWCVVVTRHLWKNTTGILRSHRTLAHPARRSWVNCLPDPDSTVTIRWDSPRHWTDSCALQPIPCGLGVTSMTAGAWSGHDNAPMVLQLSIPPVNSVKRSRPAEIIVDNSWTRLLFPPFIATNKSACRSTQTLNSPGT